MKDHGLLQAICRTNRPYKNKSSGLVVDYIGVFDDVVKSLNFDYEGVNKVVSNIKQLEDELPNAINKCLKYFSDTDRNKLGYEGLGAAQSCIEDTSVRDEFATDYSALSRYWEVLSPREITIQYIADYKWLTSVYESMQPPTGRGRLIWKRLGPKTLKLIQDNIKVLEIENDLETLIMDPSIFNPSGNYISPQLPKQIVIKITRHIKKHENDPAFISLGQRLETAHERYVNRITNSVQYLKELLEIAKEVVVEEQKTSGKPTPVHDNKLALTKIFEQQNPQAPPKLIKKIVIAIDNVVVKISFEGWQNTITGEREIKQEIIRILLRHDLHNDDELFIKIYEYIKQYY